MLIGLAMLNLDEGGGDHGLGHQFNVASVLPRAGTTADARLDSLFVQALRARAHKTSAGAGNLYGGAAGPEAMLAAFRLLAEGTPLIRFGHVGANRIIDGATYMRRALHIVDLGIGHGLQWDDLLVRLARRHIRPRVRLTGVDLPCPGDNPKAVLEQTGARLATLAAQSPASAAAGR